MIAADTSSFIAYLAGDHAGDCEAIDEALACDALYLPPVVLLETLCDPAAQKSVGNITEKVPVLAVGDGYWRRAAMTRRTILMHKLKAKLGDALVAQSCIDYNVPLITRDADFRHYAKHCGLKLYA